MLVPTVPRARSTQLLRGTAPISVDVSPTGIVPAFRGSLSGYGPIGATMLKTSVRIAWSRASVRPRAFHLAMSSAASMASDSPEISRRESANDSRPR